VCAYTCVALSVCMRVYIITPALRRRYGGIVCVTACDGMNDVDIDECLNDNGECQHLCENSPGSHTCRCLPGYVMNDDGTTCNGNIHVYVYSDS